MSRHHAQARYGARDGRAVAGYDRPLREVFLQVRTAHEGDPGADEDVLHASLHEPWRDWTDVANVTGQLARLGIAVPDSLQIAVRLDQGNNVGNRVVEHHTDRSPTVLAG